MVPRTSSYTQIDTCINTSTCPAGTQYSENIRWMFPKCCHVPGIQGTFREHFRGKYFLKNSQWKNCFCVKIAFVVKVYDSTMTNVDLLVNSSNHKAMFSEYSKNIFMKSKSSKNCFVSYPVKILRLSLSSLAMFFWTVLKPFFNQSNALKRFVSMLDSW